MALRLESVGDRVFTWPRAGTLADDLSALAGQVRQLRAAGPLTGVGVAMPATLDARGRVTAWPTRPSWTGLDLAGVLTDLFGATPVRLADDGDLAALAEADELGCADLVYAGVGTGIGGGIVLAGRPVPGPGRGSCELGHVVVDLHGARCDCGRRGCVQAEASGPATLRRAAAAAGAPVTFDQLRSGFRDGTPWAVTAVGQGCAALAAALAGAAELVRPEVIVIGGGFAAALPGYVDEVARRLARLARPGHPPAPVRPARLGDRSSLHGAMLAARGALDG
ncbi:ROK family protein [Actinoplanes teichomyceticus]|uniref:Kanosamine 6-kinase n=1 Tax=Actinoplanes teichomyceticus TaxID=1867 RepID=A0A561WBJ1_ACTTI|nr:ROK family protein [Actinoplanes teichomyceticus]TWG21221.1 kanosamine 6-kinase [Actinoplanes teichomyceticus]GIF17077.1 kanosamine kinase [Actinoplanes teichomyceticus]